MAEGHEQRATSGRPPASGASTGGPPARHGPMVDLDPSARGAFVGLTARHGRAHLTRAVMEGVVFSLRDGLETMRLVHQQQPLIPIIVISGNPMTSESGSGPDFLTMASRLGAVASLQKPFRPAALLAAVAGCLEAAKRPSLSSTTAGDVAPGP